MPAASSSHAPGASAGAGATERRVVEYLLGGRRVTRDLNREFADTRTFGERLADFGAVLLAWVALDSVVIARGHQAFDPYYILLNLFLSMRPVPQAPTIIMSQNRQAARDRLESTHDSCSRMLLRLPLHADGSDPQAE
jgi:uncharacterized membrane protein